MGIYKEKISKKHYFCIECGKKLSEDTKTKKCIECYKKSRLKNKPSLEQLLNDVNELGYRGTGRKYSVSDNCIRKWIKNVGVAQ